MEMTNGDSFVPATRCFLQQTTLSHIQSLVVRNLNWSDLASVLQALATTVLFCFVLFSWKEADQYAEE